jgi:hypothetical protein
MTEKREEKARITNFASSEENMGRSYQLLAICH